MAEETVEKAKGLASSAYAAFTKVVNPTSITLGVTFVAASLAANPVAAAAVAKSMTATTATASVGGTAASVVGSAATSAYYGVTGSGPLFSQVGAVATDVSNWAGKLNLE